MGYQRMNICISGKNEILTEEGSQTISGFGIAAIKAEMPGSRSIPTPIIFRMGPSTG